MITCGSGVLVFTASGSAGGVSPEGHRLLSTGVGGRRSPGSRGRPDGSGRRRRHSVDVLVDRRPAATALVAGVLLVSLLGGCGRHVDERDETAQDDRSIPDHLAVSFVVAGDDEAWIAGGSGGSGVDLWEMTRDGTADRTISLPELASMDADSLAGGLAIALLRCAEGTGDGDCRGSAADVLVIDDAGTIRHEVPLWESSDPIDSGDGIDVVGTTGRTVWVSSDLKVFEVSADGEVVRQIPYSGGGECVLGGELYGFVEVDDDTSRAGEGSPPTAVAGPGQQAGSRVIEAREFDGDTWVPVEGSRRALGPDVYPAKRCTDEALEVSTADRSALVARWTPAGGWRSVTGPPPPAAAQVAAPKPSGTFALTPGGSVLARTADGSFEPTELRLPDLRTQGQPPPGLSIDRSETIVAGCTTRGTSPAVSTTVCRIAVRG